MKKLYKKFGIVNWEVLSNSSLSPQSKALYAILCVYSGDKGECFPSISTLADIMNLSDRQLSRLIKDLKDNNIIRRQGRKIILC